MHHEPQKEHESAADIYRYESLSLAVGPWESYITSLSPGALIRKTGRISLIPAGSLVAECLAERVTQSVFPVSFSGFGPCVLVRVRVRAHTRALMCSVSFLPLPVKCCVPSFRDRLQTQVLSNPSPHLWNGTLPCLVRPTPTKIGERTGFMGLRKRILSSQLE